MVQEAAHDDSTAAFLLTQSLRQRQEEVEDAATVEWRMWRRTTGWWSTSLWVASSLRSWRECGSLGASALPGCCGTPGERLSSSSGWVSSSSLTTSSRRLVVFDSCFDPVEAGVFGCGRTPSTPGVRKLSGSREGHCQFFTCFSNSTLVVHPGIKF